jgi:hypothetical protein
MLAGPNKPGNKICCYFYITQILQKKLKSLANNRDQAQRVYYVSGVLVDQNFENCQLL